MTDQEIERDLVIAQARMADADRIRSQRRTAVQQAIAGGWAVSRIARALGVRRATVYAITAARTAPADDVTTA